MATSAQKQAAAAAKKAAQAATKAAQAAKNASAAATKASDAAKKAILTQSALEVARNQFNVKKAAYDQALTTKVDAKILKTLAAELKNVTNALKKATTADVNADRAVNKAAAIANNAIAQSFTAANTFKNAASAVGDVNLQKQAEALNYAGTLLQRIVTISASVMSATDATTAQSNWDKISDVKAAAEMAATGKIINPVNFIAKAADQELVQGTVNADTFTFSTQDSSSVFKQDTISKFETGLDKLKLGFSDASLRHVTITQSATEANTFIVSTDLTDKTVNPFALKVVTTGGTLSKADLVGYGASPIADAPTGGGGGTGGGGTPEIIAVNATADAVGATYNFTSKADKVTFEKATHSTHETLDLITNFEHGADKITLGFTNTKASLGVLQLLNGTTPIPNTYVLYDKNDVGGGFAVKIVTKTALTNLTDLLDDVLVTGTAPTAVKYIADGASTVAPAATTEADSYTFNKETNSAPTTPGIVQIAGFEHDKDVINLGFVDTGLTGIELTKESDGKWLITDTYSNFKVGVQTLNGADLTKGDLKGAITPSKTFDANKKDAPFQVTTNADTFRATSGIDAFVFNINDSTVDATDTINGFDPDPDPDNDQINLAFLNGTTQDIEITQDGNDLFTLKDRFTNFKLQVRTLKTYDNAEQGKAAVRAAIDTSAENLEFTADGAAETFRSGSQSTTYTFDKDDSTATLQDTIYGFVSVKNGPHEADKVILNFIKAYEEGVEVNQIGTTNEYLVTDVATGFSLKVVAPDLKFSEANVTLNDTNAHQTPTENADILRATTSDDTFTYTDATWSTNNETDLIAGFDVSKDKLALDFIDTALTGVTVAVTDGKTDGKHFTVTTNNGFKLSLITKSATNKDEVTKSIVGSTVKWTYGVADSSGNTAKSATGSAKADTFTFTEAAEAGDKATITNFENGKDKIIFNDTLITDTPSGYVIAYGDNEDGHSVAVVTAPDKAGFGFTVKGKDTTLFTANDLYLQNGTTHPSAPTFITYDGTETDHVLQGTSAKDTFLVGVGEKNYNINTFTVADDTIKLSDEGSKLTLSYAKVDGKYVTTYTDGDSVSGTVTADAFLTAADFLTKDGAAISTISIANTAGTLVSGTSAKETFVLGSTNYNINNFTVANDTIKLSDDGAALTLSYAIVDGKYVTTYTDGSVTGTVTANAFLTAANFLNKDGTAVSQATIEIDATNTTYTSDGNATQKSNFHIATSALNGKTINHYDATTSSTSDKVVLDFAYVDASDLFVSHVDGDLKNFTVTKGDFTLKIVTDVDSTDAAIKATLSGGVALPAIAWTYKTDDLNAKGNQAAQDSFTFTEAAETGDAATISDFENGIDKIIFNNALATATASGYTIAYNDDAAGKSVAVVSAVYNNDTGASFSFTVKGSGTTKFTANDLYLTGGTQHPTAPVTINYTGTALNQTLSGTTSAKDTFLVGSTNYNIDTFTVADDTIKLSDDGSKLTLSYAKVDGKYVTTYTDGDSVSGTVTADAFLTTADFKTNTNTDVSKVSITNTAGTLVSGTSAKETFVLGSTNYNIDTFTVADDTIKLSDDGSKLTLSYAMVGGKYVTTYTDGSVTGTVTANAFLTAADFINKDSAALSAVSLTYGGSTPDTTLNGTSVNDTFLVGGTSINYNIKDFTVADDTIKLSDDGSKLTLSYAKVDGKYVTTYTDGDSVSGTVTADAFLTTADFITNTGAAVSALNGTSAADVFQVINDTAGTPAPVSYNINKFEQAADVLRFADASSAAPVVTYTQVNGKAVTQLSHVDSNGKTFQSTITATTTDGYLHASNFQTSDGTAFTNLTVNVNAASENGVSSYDANSDNATYVLSGAQVADIKNLDNSDSITLSSGGYLLTTATAGTYHLVDGKGLSVILHAKDADTFDTSIVSGATNTDVTTEQTITADGITTFAGTNTGTGLDVFTVGASAANVSTLGKAYNITAFNPTYDRLNLEFLNSGDSKLYVVTGTALDGTPNTTGAHLIGSNGFVLDLSGTNTTQFGTSVVLQSAITNKVVLAAQHELGTDFTNNDSGVDLITVTSATSSTVSAPPATAVTNFEAARDKLDLQFLNTGSAKVYVASVDGGGAHIIGDNGFALNVTGTGTADKSIILQSGFADTAVANRVFSAAQQTITATESATAIASGNATSLDLFTFGSADASSADHLYTIDTFTVGTDKIELQFATNANLSTDLLTVTATNSTNYVITYGDTFNVKVTTTAATNVTDLTHDILGTY